MKRSDDVSLILPALVAALAEVRDVRKTHEADMQKYKYKFADLGDVLADVRPLLGGIGLAMTQEARTDDKGTSVVTHIVHVSGQWLEYDALRMPTGNDAQSFGSAITYARRYAAMAALGMATEDNDGATAKPAAKPPAPFVHGPDEPLNISVAALVSRLAFLSPEALAPIKAEADEYKQALTAEAFEADHEWANYVHRLVK